LVKRYLHEPLQHSVDSAESPVTAMTHHIFDLPDVTAKKELVRRLAAGQGRRLLFTRTKHQAKKLARQLTAKGVPAVHLHGNLSQNARQRNLEAYSSGTVRVLVATDIAARGIHVDDVGLVVHVDPPGESKAYLHRSGRTARAGASGAVVTVAAPGQAREMTTLLHTAGVDANNGDARAVPPPKTATPPGDAPGQAREMTTLLHTAGVEAKSLDARAGARPMSGTAPGDAPAMAPLPARDKPKSHGAGGRGGRPAHRNGGRRNGQRSRNSGGQGSRR